MINKPHHKVVLPLSMSKKAVHKIHIPPPSTAENDWKFSKDASDTGMFAYGGALIDIENPYVKPGYAFPQQSGQQDDMWWVKWTSGYSEPNWLQEWGSESAAAGTATRYGPYVQKVIKDEDSPVQITFQYKCHWQFGGDTLPPELVADPKNPDKPPGDAGTSAFWGRPQPQHPKHPSKRHIQPGDLDSGGELRDSAWARITQTTDSDYTTISESDRPVDEGLCLRRTLEAPEKKAKLKSKESSKMRAAKRHRVLGHSFDLFLAHVREQLGRSLTTTERKMVRKTWVKQNKRKKHSSPTHRRTRAASASPSSAWSSEWSHLT